MRIYYALRLPERQPFAKRQAFKLNVGINTMRVIRLGRSRQAFATAVKAAAAVLGEGGVVAFPTETAYGLAADPRSSRAVARIFAVKGREGSKALPLIAADEATVRRHFAVPAALSPLMRHWPGPLSLVLPRRAAQHLPALRGKRTAAVRVSSLPLATALARAAGGLITATSANLSGEPNLYSGERLRRLFADRARQPDLLIDGGSLLHATPSTIAAARRGRPVVLRQGPVLLD
jgi:L-threonylcarbamoyladenylate synthase